MVAPELDGGALTGTSFDFAAGLGEDDGEVDEGLRTTANSISYSSVLGAAPLLGFVVPSSGEMRTRSKSTIGAPTTMGKQGVSFGIPRAGQGRRKIGEWWPLPSSRSPMAERPRLRIPTTLPQIGQSFAATVV
jgi:hypothetical protein